MPTLVVMLLVLAPVLAAGGDVLEVGKFSAETEGDGPPAGWKPLAFKNRPRYTSYTLVKDGGTVVVQAVSDASASSLIRDIRIDPRAYPIVQWRWKVANVVKGGDPTRKDGDDYPARLYVAFEYEAAQVGLLDWIQYEAARLFYGRYPPIAALNYIWENKLPEGTIFPNPYTKRVMMVVVESGVRHLRVWRTEERNVLEDYRRAFGREPTMISGVAVMTDSDNTKETATAWFGDIRFKKAS